MKKTVFDGKQWILELLNQSNVKTIISGKIYKDKRPIGSTKEDIVINSLPMTNTFFQDGVFNVNCYVPYISVKIDGIDQNMPNNMRLEAVAKSVYPVLEDVNKSQYVLSIVDHQTFQEEAEKASYLNFRINLKAFN